MTIPLGDITVTGDGNLLDFTNTSCRLVLPNIPPIAIDNDYIINKTISVEYVFSLYDGKGVVNVRTSEGDLILSNGIDVGFNIPYAAFTNNGSVDGGNDARITSNGILTPYIEVMKHNNQLALGKYSIPVVVEESLSSVTGYVEVETMELSINATNSEIQELKRVLGSGVYIR